MIIQEGDQVGLPPPDQRAVQDVGGPQHVRGLSLEPAEHGTSPRGYQVLADEMPLQRALRRRIPGLGDHDPPYLGRGPLQVLPLQRRRHRQHRLRGNRLALAAAGHQRLEPARPPGPDPPVDGLARDLHAPAARPACTRPAMPRTTLPRCLADSPSSSAGPTGDSHQRPSAQATGASRAGRSGYRNNPGIGVIPECVLWVGMAEVSGQPRHHRGDVGAVAVPAKDGIDHIGVADVMDPGTAGS
jgi:hypothetical protein